MIRSIFIFIGLGLWIFYACTHSKESESIVFQKLFPDSEASETVSCYRIPALVTASNGDLISAIDQRVPSCDDLRSNPDINIVIRRSVDDGKSWTDIQKIVDYPDGESASDPSMIVDRLSGDIILLFNYMNLRTEKGRYYFKMIRSIDDGKTWSEPVDITSQISPEEWKDDFKFITSGRGAQTKEGVLIHTLVHLQKGVFVIMSNDQGRNWERIETPINPADESKIVELSNGEWMINSRVNKLGFRKIHRSKDKGISWVSEIDSSLVDPGCNGSLLRLASVKDDEEILLFSNPSHSTWRQHLTIKYSTDEGVTWSNERVVYEGPAAYSSMTILGNGDIGIFFEKDDYKENVYVRVPRFFGE